MKQSGEDASKNLEERITDIMDSNDATSVRSAISSDVAWGGSEADASSLSDFSCKHSRGDQKCDDCNIEKDKKNVAQYSTTKGYRWSEGNPTGSMGKHITINDLEADEQVEYRRGYIRLHSKIITRHLGYCASFYLSQGTLGRLFFPIDAIHCPEQFLKASTVSYSTKPLLIPAWLDYAVRVLFLMDLRQHGIFRVNSTVQHVTAVRALINDLTEGRLTEENGIKMLLATFDTIDIAETYKQLLRSFNTTIISSSYIPIIKSIQGISVPQDKRICTRAFLYSLPALNRRILESNARLVHLLVAKMEEFGVDGKQMNFEGMSKVMMPCLMLKPEDNIAIEDVLLFAEFIHFLLRNFTSLIHV